MKTLNLTLTAAAVAFAAIAFNANSGEALLSPRAKANQITTASGATENHLVSNTQAASPRGLANQITSVKGEETRNLVTENRNITGSPRAAAVFPASTNSKIAGACCAAKSACCTTVASCCATR